MTKFRYLVARHWTIEGWDVVNMTQFTLEDGLNYLGNQEWELVTALSEPAPPGEDTLTDFYLKQPI